MPKRKVPYTSLVDPDTIMKLCRKTGSVNVSQSIRIAIEDYIKAIELDRNFDPAYTNLMASLKHLNENKELIPKNWDPFPIEQAVKSSGLHIYQKKSILSLLKSLKT